jgi:hypothetical protein
MGRSVVAVTVARMTLMVGVIVGMVAGCAGGGGTPVVRHPDPYQLDFAAQQMRTACRSGVDAVKVVLERPPVERRFACDEVRATAGFVVQTGMFERLRDINDAAAKAARYRAFASEVQAGQQSYEELIAAFAIGRSLKCERPEAPTEIRSHMAVVENETPEEWTLYEAVRLAVDCPERLDDLYANVAKAGEPQAARRAEAKMNRAADKLELPLGTSP